MFRFFHRFLRQVSFRQAWDGLRVSFWFTPTIMGIAAVMLAKLFYYLDVLIPNPLLINNWIILIGNPEEQRTIMVGMATTTLATAGVVFSLLTLPLSTVATQYGSRLLRIYVGDRTTQFVLGMFTGTFCYCLATALMIPVTGPSSESSQLAITFAFLFFLATFASLIMLIHHISSALQAPRVVGAAGSELKAIVLALAPEQQDRFPGNRSTETVLPEELQRERGFEILANDTGYIQGVDPERMRRLVIGADLILRLVRKPGHFVAEGDLIALVWPRDHADEKLAEKISRSFSIGRQRTPTQDLEYAVNQLVEVALRAMSPAINDPFTAMTCLDHLGAGLGLYAGEVTPLANYYYDTEGKLRLIFEPLTSKQLFAAAFDMLRHASSDNASVLLKMLDTIGIIGQKCRYENEIIELLQHVELVQAESEAGNLVEADKLMIRRRCEELFNIRQTTGKKLDPARDPALLE